jgi:hypothetical protein
MKQLLHQIEQAQSWNKVKTIINTSFPKVTKKRGSSRIVVSVNDKYVLKIAYNDKGVAQNLNEYRVYRDIPVYYKRFLAKVVKADAVNGTWILQQRVVIKRRKNAWKTPIEVRLSFVCKNEMLRRYLVDQFDVMEGDLDQVGKLNDRYVLYDYGLTNQAYERHYCKW